MDRKRIFLFLILGIFMISLASAWDFDNVKEEVAETFDNITSLENPILDDYPAIKITNTFGLGSTLFEGYISQHDYTCGIECSSTIKVKLGSSGSLIDEVKFYTINGEERIEQNVRNYQFYIYTEGQEYEVEDYEYQCADTGKVLLNGTKEQICENVLVGKHTEVKPIWTPYILGEEIEEGVYIVKLEAEKRQDRSVDWVIKTNGEWLDEWATWGAGSDLLAYYKLDNSTGVVYDMERNYDGTNVGATRGATGKLNNAFSFDGTNDYINITQAVIPTGANDDFTINYWVKTFLDNGEQRQISQYTTGDAGRFMVGISSTNKSRIFIGGSEALGDYLNNDTWYMITARRDSGNLSLFVNGEYKNSLTNTDAISNDYFLIGQAGDGGYTSGTLDEIGIWNTSLGISDIENLYNGGEGLGYGFGINISLISPNHNSVVSSREVQYTIFGNVTGGAFVKNMSLWTNETGSWEQRNTTTLEYSDVTDSLPAISWTSGGSLTGKTGIRILSKNDQRLVSATKKATVTATTGYLYDIGDPIGGSLLDSSAFVGNVVTFNYQLEAGKTYFIVVDSGGGSYTEAEANPYAFPRTGTNVDFTGSWYITTNRTAEHHIFESVITNEANETPTQTWNRTYTSGDTILWGAKMCDTDDVCQFSNYNRTFRLDTEAPQITITKPTILETYGGISFNETLNVTFTDTSLDSCWYNYNGTNVTIDGCSSGISNETNFILEENNFNITIYANDSVGNVNSTFYEWEYIVFQTNQSYEENTTEASTETFSVNVTWLNDTYNDINAYLNYNGTRQSIATRSLAGNKANFTYDLGIPSVDTDTNVTFYWEFLLEGNYYNSDPLNQTIYNIAVDDCSVYTNVLFNMTMYDEGTNTYLNETQNNTLIDAELIMKVDGIEVISYSNTYTQENPAYICSELDLSGSSYTYDMIISFSSNDHVNEFYYIDNNILDGTTIPKNISLMDLLSVDSTSFLFNYYNENGLVVDNSVVRVMRKYVGEGLFREVERSKADQNGDTIIHLVEEDVIYYFVITLNGVVQYTSDVYTALCQEVPCTIVISASDESNTFDTDWDLVDGGSFLVTSNSDARNVTLTYDLEDSGTFNLTLYQYESDGSYTSIDSGSSTGTSGTITVHAPLISGNTTFFASVTKDDEFINSQWIDFSDKSKDYFGSSMAVFLAILIILSLGLMAVTEGIGTMIMVMFGVIVSGFLGLIGVTIGSTGINIAIFLVLAGGIIIWKLAGGKK